MAFGIGMISPFWKADGICPYWRIELKMAARISGRIGPAYKECSLTI